MKKTIIALSLAAMSLPALAQDKKAPAPDYTIAGNFGLFSDYRFRGVSQTTEKAAVQGGFDFSHKSGLYLGTWASNVNDWANTTGNGMEIDFYGGFKGSLPMEVGFDLGYIAYQYPGTAPTSPDPKQNTRELYLGLSKGPVSYKISRTMSDAWFGIARAKGSLYHDLTLSYGVTEQLVLSAHAGYQKIKGNAEGETSFKDYKIGGAYDLGGGYAVGLAFTKVSFKNKTDGEAWFQTAQGKALYKNGTVLSLTKAF